MYNAQTPYNPGGATPFIASPTWINVQDWGARGDNSNDDHSAIVNAISSSQPGDVIYFPACNFWRTNKAVYLIHGDLQLPGGRAYIGGGGALDRAPTIQVMSSFSSIGAIAGSLGWYATSNAAAADDPIYVFNLLFDGNAQSGTAGSGHGLAMMNWHAIIEQVQVQNVYQDGFYLPGQMKDGIHTYSSQASENRLINCKAHNCGDNGFRINDTAGSKMTDVIFQNCIVDGTGQAAPQKYASGTYHGFFTNESAGDYLVDCHTYGNDGDGFHILKGWATTLDRCYIDGIGASGTSSSATIHGIYVEVKSASTGMRGVSVSHCKIGDSGTPTYSVYGIRLIDFQGGKGYATVTGNVVSIQATGTSTQGLSYETSSNGTFYVASVGNVIGGKYTPTTYSPHIVNGGGGTVTKFSGV